MFYKELNEVYSFKGQCGKEEKESTKKQNKGKKGIVEISIMNRDECMNILSCTVLGTATLACTGTDYKTHELSMYMCLSLCVCVCVCERERERERE